ncbi:MAG: hypothetical protein A3F84_01810 [Candidatus Handelsmanbacteria bacterium RIFCSPLOWO2_12_FULL_64_10]|uniref:Uncharacterized protein n=1 Tax=Handelsmanbacteria sp. (strain RIFCSPLOWO2_12_FULL_64_10) TaxID=1817868 RepID=A0A1F6CA22_HANXR|nr:MAG: hypothetical protein A3F84_01810 [Candidatus Handelsmanbacteria bacterium RIFCSPLOWO2_12_FULL_64_10]
MKPTLHEQYLARQLEDPEFRARYALAREKARLEMMLETLREHIEMQVDRKTLLSDVRKISKHLQKVAV